MSGGTAAVSAVVTVVAAAASAYAQYEGQRAQARSQKQAAEYNMQVAANEEATQKQLEMNEIAKGVADRERQQRQAARAMGEMRSNMGASGFEMDSGTNLSLLAEQAAEHQYDSAVIASNSEQAAWQHQVAGVNAANQGSLANWQHDNASSGMTAAGIGMGGSLLSGIGSGIGAYNAVNNTSKPSSTPSGISDPWGRAHKAYPALSYR